MTIEQAIAALEQCCSEWVDTLNAGELIYVIGLLLFNIHALTVTGRPEGAMQTVRVYAAIAEKAARRLVDVQPLTVDDTIHDPLHEFLYKLTEDYNAAVGQ